MSQDTLDPKVVAIIGAGPAGLVCARWLLARGFEPVIFEASDDLGGQWNAACATSATWPGMVTNTSRVMTAFSDLDHPEGTPTYPTREAIHAYLVEYAETFGLLQRIRFGTRIERLSRDGAGAWLLEWSSSGVGADHSWTSQLSDWLSKIAGKTRARFAHVVVATGRQTTPDIPRVPGLDSFAGKLGVKHTSQYEGASAYKDATVVIGGCSISALEIATDLAHAGARVITAFRRQRYILPKLQSGVPTEHVMFTRAAALAGERLPAEAAAEGLKQKILAVNGSPEQWGALTPDEDIMKAGVTQAQGFLPAVAEGRIRTAPWIDAVEGADVRFADGTQETADAILFGTGFKLSLPFLDEATASTLKADDQGIDLYAETFHPDLPGLAFLGQFNLTGPYLPVLELQARWLASAWAEGEPKPDQVRDALTTGAYQPVRGAGVPMHVMAMLFSRLGGVEPDFTDYPDLERALLFGPLSPASFRLTGADAEASAYERTIRSAEAFGHIVGKEFSPEQSGLRAAITA